MLQCLVTSSAKLRSFAFVFIISFSLFKSVPLTVTLDFVLFLLVDMLPWMHDFLLTTGFLMFAFKDGWESWEDIGGVSRLEEIPCTVDDEESVFDSVVEKMLQSVKGLQHMLLSLHCKCNDSSVPPVELSSCFFAAIGSSGPLPPGLFKASMATNFAISFSNSAAESLLQHRVFSLVMLRE